MLMSNKVKKNVDKLSELKTYHVGIIESAAHRALRKHKDSLLQDYGITGIEWYIIGAVYDSGNKGIRITDLAKMLGTTMGFLTKTVNLLEAKGILQRKANQEDARSSFVFIKNSYKSQVDEIEFALRQKLRNSLYGLISREDLKTYIEVLNKFSGLK